MSEITVEVGEQSFTFDVELEHQNQYINDMLPNDKVGPGFNLLSRTIVDEDRDAFKKTMLVDGKPNGFLVMQVVAVVLEDTSGDIQVSVKKQNKSPDK